MATERDLSALLPPMPPPRPDAREAAIGAAMRRFDGAAPAPTAAAPARRKFLLGRPQMGALVAAALVAAIGLPLWLSGDLTPHVPTRTQSESAPPSLEQPAEAPALADVASPDPAERAAPTALPAPVVAVPNKPSEAREDAQADMASVPPPSAMAAPAPVAAPPPPAPPPAPEAAPVADEATNDVVVTGSRVSRRAASKAWAEERRAAAFAEEDLSAAARADGAVMASTPSATDWLNRGLAHARAGDDKRALGDLDRAVKLAPGNADIRYQRSLILRRLGKITRADADAAKAAKLDPRYKTGN